MAAEDMIQLSGNSLSVDGDPTKLYEALAKAQGNFIPIPKQSSGQIGKRDFKYAGYATIMRCVRPALKEQGIVVLQPLHSSGTECVTTTILAGHGASITSSFAFERHKDPQEFGRHHTYYRRYQLQAMLGLEGDKDADDLPDVNVVQGQFVEEQAPEPKKLPAAKETKPAAAPKANGASVEPKSAPANEPKNNGSVKPSDASTTGKSVNDIVAEIPEHGADKLKELITSGMRQLGWKMVRLREFWAENVDPVQFESADEMPLDKMRLLHRKMVEKHAIAPF